MRTPRHPARAEVVGSLLRPPALRAAMAAVYEPGHHALLAEERRKDLGPLRAAEDEAIRAVVQRQIECGLDVVSDGELRRWLFLNSFYDAVEGVATDRSEVEFTNAGGETVLLTVPSVVERLRPVDSPGAREAAFLTSATEHPFKVSFPAASIFAHPFGVSTSAYETSEEFVAHAIEIERTLIADAIAAGCGYVQLDFPLYPYLVDESWVERFRAAGHDVDVLLDRAIAADQAILEGIPEDVTTGIHICRGNYRSRWLCWGSLDPVAERVFTGLPYDAFLVEWDDVGRDGGYAPVRFVPKGRVAVMGVVNSKTRELEAEDDILRRLTEAAGYADLDRLAVSTQCGFASVMEGNETDEDTQWRKLELVARVADRLWG